jgi:hypothetical protein
VGVCRYWLVACGACVPRDDIDAELRLFVAVRQSIREQGGDSSSRRVDELLDERGMATDG